MPVPYLLESEIVASTRKLRNMGHQDRKRISIAYREVASLFKNEFALDGNILFHSSGFSKAKDILHIGEI